MVNASYIDWDAYIVDGFTVYELDQSTMQSKWSVDCGSIHDAGESYTAMAAPTFGVLPIEGANR
jgi:hypothetical protein